MLPGDVLIADRSNNRLLVVDPQGRIVWRFPRAGPQAAYPSPTTHSSRPTAAKIVATEEDVSAVTVIDVATGRIVYRYGEIGVPGSGPNHLSNPDDALLLPNGSILLADIKNCRLLVLRPPSHRPAQAARQSGAGLRSRPAARVGKPERRIPAPTQAACSSRRSTATGWTRRADAAMSSGRRIRPASPTRPTRTRCGPACTSPSAGKARESSRRSTARAACSWRYRPRAGEPPLNRPSLAEPLPNGDFLVNDDFNDRVIVIDPHTNRVVWQYGHMGVPGRAPGYLSRPDGVDLAPPAALLTRIQARIRLR